MHYDAQVAIGPRVKVHIEPSMHDCSAELLSRYATIRDDLLEEHRGKDPRILQSFHAAFDSMPSSARREANDRGVYEEWSKTFGTKRALRG
eukprot:COSAG04_NODE_11173_length_726_cov_0.480064_2_plen_91_part_00